MQTLAHHDLQNALRRTPRRLLEAMKDPVWAGKIFVGGGFLRSVIAGEPVNDVDVFVSSKEDAKKLADKLAFIPENASRVGAPLRHRVYESDNAFTIRGFGPAVQIIHRWVFNKAEDVAKSFDFTICCAVFWWGEYASRSGLGDSDVVCRWKSYCDERFYPDLAAKRLHYRSPVRNEDAGGSLLRVLKYYQKGYRIPLNSLGAVIARLWMGIEESGIRNTAGAFGLTKEQAFAHVVTGLLREVDPDIDPNHIAHLPSETEENS